MFNDSNFIIESLGDYINEVIRLKVRNGEQEYFQWFRGHADKSWICYPRYYSCTRQ